MLPRQCNKEKSDWPNGELDTYLYRRAAQCVEACLNTGVIGSLLYMSIISCDQYDDNPQSVIIISYHNVYCTINFVNHFLNFVYLEYDDVCHATLTKALYTA